MPEFSHHIAWLNEVRTALEHGPTPADIPGLLSTCDQVLQQNSTSELATSLRTQLTRLLDPSAPQRENPERLTARKIEEADRGMASLRGLMEGKLSSARSPIVKTAAMNPFVVYDANRANPFRNYETAAAKATELGLAPEAFVMSLRDPRHFTFMTVPDSKLQNNDMIIGSVAMRRAIAIGESYDFSTIFRQLTMCHEIVHQMHQSMQRRKDIETFLRFNAQQNNPVIANEEDDAYGLELESMNLLLDDALRTDIISGRAVEPEMFMEQLQFGANERNPAKMLAMLAKEYFGGNGTIGHYPASYKALVRRISKDSGSTPYEYGQPGVPLA